MHLEAAAKRAGFGRGRAALVDGEAGGGGPADGQVPGAGEGRDGSEGEEEEDAHHELCEMPSEEAAAWGGRHPHRLVGEPIFFECVIAVVGSSGETCVFERL